MNRIFGIPQAAVALVAIATAIVLVVVAGLILIGSAAIRALMTPGVKLEGVSLLALLVTIIVLLVAVFVLLVIVYRCACRCQEPRTGKYGEALPDPIALLLPLQPLLLALPNLLREVALATYEAGYALQWVSDNLSSASAAVTAVATAASTADISVPAVTATGTGKFTLPVEFDMKDVNPLASVLGDLQSLANALSTANLRVHLDTGDVELPAIIQKLKDVGQALGRMADALHATPRPPSQLL
ncbi:MAG TPA: hypothetical protein VFA59_15345 [Vicinamibacterales bacterium]|nr:hypothetical protein [Vicinamibacterales bacterium]